MTTIDDLKRRAEALGFDSNGEFDLGVMCGPSILRANNIYQFESFIVLAEHAVRVAVERTKASARMCDCSAGCSHTCTVCGGSGIVFEEVKQ